MYFCIKSWITESAKSEESDLDGLNQSWCLSFSWKDLVVYDFMTGSFLTLSVLSTHRPAVFNICVCILTVFCALCFSGWTLAGTICLWCSGQTAENLTEHIFDEWMCWFMPQIGFVMVLMYVCVCVSVCVCWNGNICSDEKCRKSAE